MSTTLGTKDIGIRKIRVCGKCSIPFSKYFPKTIIGLEMLKYMVKKPSKVKFSLFLKKF